MAHPRTIESGRNETVDTTSSSPKTGGGMHLTGYAGLALAVLLLVAVLILQNVAR